MVQEQEQSDDSGVFSLPAYSPPQGFDEIFVFAHEFDSNLIDNWDQVRTRGIQIHDQWENSRTFPADLSLLRGILLLQVRSSRFIEGFPSEEDMPYFFSLQAKIRELMRGANEQMQ